MAAQTQKQALLITVFKERDTGGRIAIRSACLNFA
jgi:hypothetical protein